MKKDGECLVDKISRPWEEVAKNNLEYCEYCDRDFAADPDEIVGLLAPRKKDCKKCHE